MQNYRFKHKSDDGFEVLKTVIKLGVGDNKFSFPRSAFKSLEERIVKVIQNEKSSVELFGKEKHDKWVKDFGVEIKKEKKEGLSKEESKSKSA